MVLRAESIRHSFFHEGRTSEILKEINISLQGGNMYALQGRSGSGKTTLMSILCGILAPSRGRVYMDGTELYSMNDSELSRFRGIHFGIIPQGRSAVPALTVMENVMLPASVSGSSADADRRAQGLLDMMGISDLAGVMPAELSGGEQRRMAIARALILDPDIIFADEPTSDLDAENTREVFCVLKNAVKRGKTVFVVSHEKCISEYADVIYHMEGGRLHSPSGCPKERTCMP